MSELVKCVICFNILLSVCSQTSVNNTIAAADAAQDYIDNNVADLVTDVSIDSYVTFKE